MYVSPLNLETCHQNSCFLCFGMQVFAFDSWSLHPDSLFMEKWMHKSASLCHRKPGFCLFGMQRIVFPCHLFPSNPSIRMQTLIDTVSFVHTKPWLLPEMDAGLLLWSVLLYVSPLATPGCSSAVGCLCVAMHMAGGARPSSLCAPTPRTCAWIANTQATHRLMTSPGEWPLPLNPLFLWFRWYIPRHSQLSLPWKANGNSVCDHVALQQLSANEWKLL